MSPLHLDKKEHLDQSKFIRNRGKLDKTCMLRQKPLTVGYRSQFFGPSVLLDCLAQYTLQLKYPYVPLALSYVCYVSFR